MFSSSFSSDSEPKETIGNKSIHIFDVSPNFSKSNINSNENIITPKLAMTLNRCKLTSDRDAVHILAAIRKFLI